MNEEVCLEKHKRIEEKCGIYDIRLNDHGKRLDKLEQDGRELKTELKNLCENLKSLTNMIKWFITAIGGAFISFFFYVVQNNILK